MFMNKKIWRKKIRIWSANTFKLDSISLVIYARVCVCCVYDGFSNGHFDLKIRIFSEEICDQVVKFLWKIFKFKMKIMQSGEKIFKMQNFNANPILSIRDLQWTFHQWHHEGCCISPAPACNKWISVSIGYKSSSEFSKMHTLVSISYYICKPHKQNCSLASTVSGIHELIHTHSLHKTHRTFM